jgi:hypothetical protein
MTRTERAQLERILEAATKAARYLEAFRAARDDMVDPAMAAAFLDEAIAGLRALLGKNDATTPT